MHCRHSSVCFVSQLWSCVTPTQYRLQRFQTVYSNTEITYLGDSRWFKGTTTQLSLTQPHLTKQGKFYSRIQENCHLPLTGSTFIVHTNVSHWSQKSFRRPQNTHTSEHAIRFLLFGRAFAILKKQGVGDLYVKQKGTEGKEGESTAMQNTYTEIKYIFFFLAKSLLQKYSLSRLLYLYMHYFPWEDVAKNRKKTIKEETHHGFLFTCCSALASVTEQESYK